MRIELTHRVIVCIWMAGSVPMYIGRAVADVPAFNLPGRDFTATDRYISTNVFHWFTAGGGQGSGPWRPLEGKPAWTGEPDFWVRQIKDMMDAGIDVLHVHLIPSSEQQRINLFTAFSQLRTQGYKVPQVAPFLDPLITWSVLPPIDVSTAAGKDEFVGQYIRFFNQYFSQNTDPQAESHLLHIGGKIVLDTWHCNSGYVNNMGSLTRSDVETRLAAAFGGVYSTFNNGIYMIGTVNGTAPSFSDEKMYQFSNTAYESAFTFNNKKAATMKAGYWDQNIRNPGIFFPRDGGGHYVTAGNYLNSIRNGGNNVDGQALALPIYHANVESWNEYDEGTGVYSADPGPPYIAPSNTSGNTDVWSSTNNPREYIDTTAGYASAFNGLPARDAKILWHEFPSTVFTGKDLLGTIVLRNQGNAQWSAAQNYKLGQVGTTLLESHFDADAGGWTLVQNAFGTTGNTSYETGTWAAGYGSSGGGVRTHIGNVNATSYTGTGGASAGWSKTFHLNSTRPVAINFKWRLFHPKTFESDERGEARFEIDNVAYGLNAQIYLARFSGGTGVDLDTGWQDYANIVTLSGPADHTLEIGGFNNKKTAADEVMDVYIDDVVVSQADPDTVFTPARILIDDAADEIPTYNGIFRGRPKTFDVAATAPIVPGNFTLHFQMLQESVAWFGERLDVPVQVVVPGDLDHDIDIDQSDFGAFQKCLSGGGVPYVAGCDVADFNSDGAVDVTDVNIFLACFSGAGIPADGNCNP